MTERQQYIKQVEAYVTQFEGNVDGGLDHIPTALDRGDINMTMHPGKAADIVMQQVAGT
jgi:hypothetical protein